MPPTISPNYRKCAEVGQNVRTDRTEGDCRTENGCQQADCPLTRDFTPERPKLVIGFPGLSRG